MGLLEAEILYFEIFQENIDGGHFQKKSSAEIAEVAKRRSAVWEKDRRFADGRCLATPLVFIFLKTKKRGKLKKKSLKKN